MLALLEILQSGGTRTVGDLASRLGVDERTVRRYVAHLIDLDIPVQSVRGRYGGYRLAAGFRMPPLMFTDEEALATLLGLLAGTRAGLATTSTPAAESAAAKLRRVLPDALRQRLDALLESTEFTAQPRPVLAPEAQVLLTLANAAKQRRPVEITYTAADGRRTERTVQPYGIVVHSGRWYVAGADSASGQNRTFRVDRISNPRTQSGTFTVPPGFDPRDHVLSGLAQAPYRHHISIRVAGSGDHVRARLPASLTTVSDLADDNGWVRVQMRTEQLDWVPALLAGLGRPFIVERPDALRDLLRELADQLTAAARRDHGSRPTRNHESGDTDSL